MGPLYAAGLTVIGASLKDLKLILWLSLKLLEVDRIGMVFVSMFHFIHNSRFNDVFSPMPY